MNGKQRAIVILPSSLHLLNNGDAAMLQVTVQRFQQLAPAHQIYVFADNANLLSRYCPGAEWLDPAATDLRACAALVPQRLMRRIPHTAQFWLTGVHKQWMSHSPGSYRAVAMAAAGSGSDRMRATLGLLSRTDAVVCTGGGFVNDSFPSVAVRIMEELSVAAAMKCTVAMFGQGLGPVTNASVVAAAKELFPKLATVGLREGLAGVPLATEWMRGSESRIHVTGDDAIEPAYEHRPPTLGNGIGFNIRVSHYSGVALEQAAQIVDVIQRFTSANDAPIIPAIISRHPKDSDVNSLRQVLRDTAWLDAEDNYDAPEKVARTIGACRLVVTGSYHAGVFALSQGIPIIGLTRSGYYEQKFAGLAYQFKCGVEIVRLDEPAFLEQMAERLAHVWESAPQWRDKLLHAAKQQIDIGQRVYADFASVLNQRREAACV